MAVLTWSSPSRRATDSSRGLVRQNVRMKLAIPLLLALAGCPHPAPRTTTPVTTSPEVQPDADVTAAGGGGASGGSDATGDDHRLGDGKPKVTDLDVVHLDVVGHDKNGDPIIEAKTPGPLLAHGNDAFAAGKLDEAVKWYAKLVAEF